MNHHTVSSVRGEDEVPLANRIVVCLMVILLAVVFSELGYYIRMK